MQLTTHILLDGSENVLEAGSEGGVLLPASARDAPEPPLGKHGERLRCSLPNLPDQGLQREGGEGMLQSDQFIHNGAGEGREGGRRRRGEGGRRRRGEGEGGSLSSSTTKI